MDYLNAAAPYLLGVIFQVLSAIGVALVLKDPSFGFSEDDDTDIKFTRGVDASQSFAGLASVAFGSFLLDSGSLNLKYLYVGVTFIFMLGVYLRIKSKSSNAYDVGGWWIFSWLNITLIVLNLLFAGAAMLVVANHATTCVPATDKPCPTSTRNPAG